MRHRGVAAVLLASPLLGGAAGEDERWLELKAAGFTVVSDAGEREARAVLGQLERIRALMSAEWPWARVEPTRPVVVLAVRNSHGLRALLPAAWEKAGARPPDGVFVSAPERSWIALRVDARSRDDWTNPWHVAFHEYVHLLLRLNFASLPPWLSEGLAEYWGSTRIDGDRVYEGRHVPCHLETLRARPLLPLLELFAVPHDSFSEQDRATLLYAESWALVHYLTLGDDRRRGQLDRYAQRLANGGDERDARAAFGDLAALERELEQYARRQRLPWRRVSASPKAVADATRRSLADAESLALRAAFHVATGRRTEAAELLTRALAADPASIPAHETAALAAWRWGRGQEALAALETVVASPAASAFDCYLHARLLWSEAPPGKAPLDRVEASARRAVDLAPDFPDGLDLLAQALAARGASIGQTLPLAVRASRLEPAEMSYKITVLRLTARAGQVDEAREAAQELLPRAAGEDRQQLELLLRQYPAPR